MPSIFLQIYTLCAHIVQPCIPVQRCKKWVKVQAVPKKSTVRPKKSTGCPKKSKGCPKKKLLSELLDFASFVS